MSHEVVIIGSPVQGAALLDGPAQEWQAFRANAVSRLHLILTQMFPGEITVRHVEAESPEVADYPEATARLSSGEARLPLVVVDGRLVGEGSFSAGTIAAYLKDGQIPKSL